MARAELSVHSFLLVYQIRREPTVPRFTLFGADQTIIIPADTEFPRALPQLDFFVRFFVEKPGLAKLRIRIQWDERDPTEVGRFRLRRSLPTGGVYADEALRFPRVSLPDEGRYRVTLSQRVVSAEAWRGRAMVWRRLGTEYFIARRGS